MTVPDVGSTTRPVRAESADVSLSDRSLDLGKWIAPVVSFVLILALWQATVLIFRLPRFVLPPPLEVLTALVNNLPILLRDTWITGRETVAGFFLSIAVAVPLAILITASAPLRNGIYPFLLLGQSVPKQAIAPLLLLWIGYGEFPRVILAFLTAFFPIVVNTAIGLQMTPPEMQDLGRLLSASRRRVFFKVTFPCAMPYFFAGLKVAISLAVIGAVIGEFIGGDTGLGQRILVASGNQRTDLAFAAILMLSLLGILLFTLVALAEKLLCPWYDKS